MKMTRIVGQLKKERDRAQTELGRLDTALGSLNGSFRGVRPTRRTIRRGRTWAVRGFIKAVEIAKRAKSRSIVVQPRNM